MYNYIIYETTTGRITSTVTYENSTDILLNDLTDKSYIEGDLTLPELKQSYVKNNEIKTMPFRPSYLYEFNYSTEQWEQPTNYLDIIKSTTISQINQITSEVILERYPLYKQLNNIDTPEYEPMRIWIDSKRSKSNIASSAVTNATSENECNSILQNFINIINED